jgi:hypothetical protein
MARSHLSGSFIPNGFGWQFMISDSTQNFLFAARAANSWVARAGTRWKPCPPSCLPNETARAQQSALPQNGRGLLFGAGSVCAPATRGCESR